MEITEVRVKLVKDTSDQLKAFCSITLDGLFVIRDLKVIERRTGFFVAMPSRKVSDRCPKCRYKNHIRARFCNECGEELRSARGGRVKLYVDVAHPINSECRQLVQQRVIDAFEEEFERAKEPGYVGQDYDETDGDVLPEAVDDHSRDDPGDTSPTPSVDSADDERDDDRDADRDTDRDGEPRGSEYDELIRSLKNEAQARRSRHDGSARPVHTSPPRVESTLDEPESTDELGTEEPAPEEAVVEEPSAREPEPTPATKPTVEPAHVAAAPISPRPEPAAREPVRPEPTQTPAAPAPTSSFGEGLDVDESPEPPSVEAPSQDQPAAASPSDAESPSEVIPSHAESTEDDSGFGAGIL